MQMIENNCGMDWNKKINNRNKIETEEKKKPSKQNNNKSTDMRFRPTIKHTHIETRTNIEQIWHKKDITIVHKRTNNFARAIR